MALCSTCDPSGHADCEHQIELPGKNWAIPLEEAEIEGNLELTTLDGTITGIVPVESFVEGVLPIFIPSEGYDIDGDGELESQADLIDLATQLLDTGADTVTASGEPAISAAFHFSAVATVF